MKKNNIFLPTAAVSFDYASIKPSVVETLKTQMPDRSMVFPVVLSYTGIRPYYINGQKVLVLRREEQVFSESHLKTLRFVTNTKGHPKIDYEGTFRNVWLDVRGRGEVDNLDFVHLPPGDFSVGHTGEEVWKEKVDGVNMPVGLTCIKNADCLKDIVGGLVQTSLGYFGLRLPPPPSEQVEGYGVWESPSGPQKYHLEQVLDLEDPRLQPPYLLEQGIVKSLEEAQELRAKVGVNHLAVAIPEGRGGPNVRIQLDEKKESFFDMDIRNIKSDARLGVCLDVSMQASFIDTGSSKRDSKTEATTNLASMKYNISHTLPRLTSILDEMGTSSMPHKEVDVPADVLEVLKMAEEAIVKTFEVLRTQLQETQKDLASSKAELVEKETESGISDQKKVQVEDSLTKLQADYDRVLAERDQAVAELKPIQKKQLLNKITEILKTGGLDVSKAGSFDSIESAQRAVVLEKVPTLKDKEVSSDYISGRYQAIVDSVSETSKDTEFFALHRKHAQDENFEGLPDAGQLELEKFRKKCG